MNKKVPAFYKFCKSLKWTIFLFYKPKIIGKENIPKEGPVIIAGNHINYLDPCFAIASSKIGIHYMVKEDYFESKKFGWFFKKLGCICVHKNKKNFSSIKMALSVLNDNGAIGIFPEGTRNKTENLLLPFRDGTVTIAKKTNAYIVPMGIKGDYKFRSKNLKIEFAKPFKVDDMSIEEANKKLFNEVKKIIE